MLGVSTATLRRVFEGKLVQAVVDGNGHHRFVVDDLLRARVAYPRKKRAAGAPTPPPVAAIDGDLAATVAARLDAGATAIDIVKELRISPDELDPIVRWWRAEHDGIWMSGEQVLELFKTYRSAAALMLPGKHNVAKALEREAPRSAAGVAAMVKVLFDELDARQRLATCKACGRAESEVCVECYGRQRRRGR
jgi:hypothetical protein